MEGNARDPRRRDQHEPCFQQHVQRGLRRQVSVFSDACQSAWDNGISVFASSGNNSLSGAMTIPACYSSVDLPVRVQCAIRRRMGSRALRIEAPSSTFSHLASPSRGPPLVGALACLRGLSACPHAVGVACLLRELDPSISPSKIREVLVGAGRPYEDPRSGLVFPILDARRRGRSRVGAGGDRSSLRFLGWEDLRHPGRRLAGWSTTR